MIRIFQWRESHIRANTRVRRKKKSKRARLSRVTVQDPSRKVNHLSKVVLDRRIIAAFTRFVSFTRWKDSFQPL